MTQFVYCFTEYSTRNLLVIVIVRVNTSVVHLPRLFYSFKLDSIPLHYSLFLSSPLSVVLQVRQQNTTLALRHYNHSSVYTTGVGEVTSFIQGTFTPAVCNRNN